MLFACRCLNFIIETRDSTRPCEEDVKSLLSPTARSQELVMVACKSAKRKIDDLVVTKASNGWTEFSCAMCELWIFASQSKAEDLMWSMIVVNQQCMTTADEIELLQSNECYSQAFKIIVEQVPPARQYLSDHINLHPTASLWIKDQTIKAEVRVNDFTNEQFEQLEKLKKRAGNEQLAINDAKMRAKVKEDQLNRERSSMKMEKSSSMSAMRRDRMPAQDEDVFFLDLGDEEEESDSEESDDEPKEQPPVRNRVDDYGHARSLPIPLPKVVEDRVLNERLERSPRTPQEMAENIRALAESVRGTAVFGELPPPRCPNKMNR